jgi:hypothetical protein
MYFILQLDDDLMQIYRMKINFTKRITKFIDLYQVQTKHYHCVKD